MLGTMKLRLLTTTVLATLVAISPTPLMPAAAQSVDQEVDELRDLVERQRAVIEALSERLDQVENEVSDTRTTADEAAAEISQIRDRDVADAAVTSGDTGLELAISGQINRLVNVANDGDDTDLFLVDNDNSSSRVRFIGTGDVTPEFTVGTQIEVQLESNSSASVSQEDEDLGSTTFTDRKVELFFDHDDYGRLWLGQGDTASNGTAEVDLSGTSVVAYSGVTDLAGGLRFFDDDEDELSATDIGDAFSNFDGLSRQDRLRYDTPTFAGFTVSGDIVSDDRWSTALRWSGAFSDLKAAAAAAYSDPGGDDDYIIDGSGSILHEPTGLNLTLSAGTREFDDRDAGVNYYGKLGLTRDFFDVGATAFSLDYTYNEDIAQEGDEGQSIGLFGVQNFTSVGTELFAGVRWYSLDRNNADFDDIFVTSVGTRVKF